MKKIELRNSQLSFVGMILGQLKLNNADSAARRRFAKNIAHLFELLDDERNELRKEFCEKDKEGKPIVIDDKFQFSLEQKKKFNEKWHELEDRIVIVDVLPSNEKDIDKVREVFEREAKSFEEKKNDVFGAADFDFLETIKEVVESLKPKEA